MADETEVEEKAEEVGEATEPVVEERVAPAVDPEVARLREENARLAGRLEEVARPKPEPVKPKVYTPAEVEELFSNQQITDIQRIAYYADRNYEARRAQEREQETREAPEHAAAQDLQEYIDKHPDLSNPDSELIGKVKAELGHLAARYGKDTTTKLTQLEAVRNVVGGHRLGGGSVEAREFSRRRQLGGGGGGPAAGEEGKPKPKSKGADLFDRMTPDAQASWLHMRGSKEAAVKTLEHATDDSVALMRKAGRFR